jgi:hypothetical protein
MSEWCESEYEDPYAKYVCDPLYQEAVRFAQKVTTSDFARETVRWLPGQAYSEAGTYFSARCDKYFRECGTRVPLIEWLEAARGIVRYYEVAPTHIPPWTYRSRVELVKPIDVNRSEEPRIESDGCIYVGRR